MNVDENESGQTHLIKLFLEMITITFLQIPLELRFRALGTGSRLEINVIVRNFIVRRRQVECKFVSGSHLTHMFCHWTWMSGILFATPKGAHHALALDLDSATEKEFKVIVLLSGKLGGRFGTMDTAFGTR